MDHIHTVILLFFFDTINFRYFLLFDGNSARDVNSTHIALYQQCRFRITIVAFVEMDLAPLLFVPIMVQPHHTKCECDVTLLSYYYVAFQLGPVPICVKNVKTSLSRSLDVATLLQFVRTV